MKANLKGSTFDGRIDQDRHRARLWLVLRMMISTTLAYALATALRLPQGYWAVLTAIIVTQNRRRWVFEGGNRPPRLFDLRRAGRRLSLRSCCCRPHADRSLALVLVSGRDAARSADRLRPALPHRACLPRLSSCLSSRHRDIGPLGYALNRVLEITLGVRGRRGGLSRADRPGAGPCAPLRGRQPKPRCCLPVS